MARSIQYGKSEDKNIERIITILYFDLIAL